MIISNITPPQVWSASSRSLTNIGSGAIASVQTSSTALAANTSVDLRTTGSQIGQVTIGVSTGAAAVSVSAVQQFDGVAVFNAAVTAASANASVAFTGYNNATVGLRVTNTDATHAGTYAMTGYIWTP